MWIHKYKATFFWNVYDIFMTNNMGQNVSETLWLESMKDTQQ